MYNSSQSSIGYHKQESNDDINFIVSGEGIAICDDVEEILKPGVCHICPKGSSHSITNTGSGDLIFFTVVPTRWKIHHNFHNSNYKDFHNNFQ